ncbi:unnamed protein product [Cylicostephanus goldi]|uniref:Uncharacterized protein n=1 Tax=Cylicostephanus goldi TaxID=71465 RepID=A0A3P6RX34_CYLGO|nr:unnamed protein product [Cylicostephanus goldi]
MPSQYFHSSAAKARTASDIARIRVRSTPTSPLPSALRSSNADSWKFRSWSSRGSGVPLSKARARLGRSVTIEDPAYSPSRPERLVLPDSDDESLLDTIHEDHKYEDSDTDEDLVSRFVLHCLLRAFQQITVADLVVNSAPAVTATFARKQMPLNAENLLESS